MQQQMETSLNAELTEGEELLWSGSPDPHTKSIVSPARVFLILALVFGIVGIVLLVIGVIIQITTTDPQVRQGMLGLEIPGGTFILLAIMFTIFTIVYSKVPRNMLYAITNRRAIIIRTGTYTTIDSFAKNDIGPIRRLERPDGSGDLIFALHNQFGYNSQNSGSYGNSYNTYNSGYNPGRYGTGIFLSIHDVRLAERILITTLK